MLAGLAIEVMERAWTGRSCESRNNKNDVEEHTGATARRCGARDHGGRLRINCWRRWERLDSLGGVLGQAAAVLVVRYIIGTSMQTQFVREKQWGGCRQAAG